MTALLSSSLRRVSIRINTKVDFLMDRISEGISGLTDPKAAILELSSRDLK